LFTLFLLKNFFLYSYSLKNTFSSFLDGVPKECRAVNNHKVGTRKEAKEPLPKFNTRDESRSLMPAKGGHTPLMALSRHQKSLHSSPPIRSSSEISAAHAQLIAISLIFI
jgi:hypothetical protein